MNWHSQNIRGYYFVFIVSSNFLQNLPKPYNLLYNLILKLNNSFATKLIYLANSVLFL